ncbi:MAG: Panacea domain-containing protein [Bacteroidales bacterium]|jgi:transcriptional regulator NrdR family protein/uncharacterized phage-associated protein|nr:Panacea domain-containing protein [Bacteroidales bacterium]
MNQKIECTYCDGYATIVKNPKTLSYRKESFKVIEHFYKCQKCQKEFTTTEVDELTFIQLHNQYREKYKIPFIDEIIEIRSKYELSAVKMSEVLGLGVNGYGNFEKREIPGPALGNLISTAANPEVFLTFVEKVKHLFTDKAYEKVKQKIVSLIHDEEDSGRSPFNWFMEPNHFTGYVKPNLDKTVYLLSLLISKCKSDFNDRLKLNKLLFYTDFYNYSQVGQSVTGLTYRAIPYGPAPTYYDNILSYLNSTNIISTKWGKDSNGSGHEYFEVEGEIEDQIFSPKELTSINIIINNFKEMTSWELVELSHKERAWKELEVSHDIISYQDYAFDLIGVKN